MTSTPPTQTAFNLLFFCMLASGAGNSMLLSIAPPLVRELHLPDSSVGWLFALSGTLFTFTSPFWGKFSDRVGRRPLIAFGLAAFGVSMGLFGFIVHLGMIGAMAGTPLLVTLVLARGIFGGFGSAASPAAQAYVADHTALAERTTRLAWLQSAMALGAAFGPAACAALAAQFGLLSPIWAMAIFLAIASVMALRFLPEAHTPKARNGSDLKESLALLFDKRVSAFLLCGLTLSILQAINQQVLGLFTMDRLNVAGHVAAEMSAWGFMANALTMLATQLLVLPRLKLSSRQLLATGSAVMIVGIVTQIFAPNLEVLLASQVLQGLGFGLARPGFVGGSSVAVTPQEQGALAGLVVGSGGTGYMLAPLFGPMLYEHIGMDAPLIVALMMVSAMFVFTLLSKRLRNPVVAPAE